MRSVSHITFVAAVIALAPSTALAWGDEGHQIIAHIAANELTPKARAQVSALLGGDAETAMVTASTWVDEIRPMRRDTAPWHFVDIPIGSSGYDPSRDCPRDDCVVGQIQRNQRIIADKRLATPVRAEALRFSSSTSSGTYISRCTPPTTMTVAAMKSGSFSVTGRQICTRCGTRP